MKQLFVIGITSIILMSFISGNKPSAKTAKKQLDEFCAYVPSGTTLDQKDTVSVQGFYMSQGEITNFQYLEFLADLRRKGELDKLKIAEPDTTNWTTELKWGNQKYVDYYFSHPAYRNYPVVNVSKEGAEMYCQWLSEKYDSLSGGELKLKFRIPTHIEWLRAVRGNQMLNTYAWGGPYLRNSKGMILANFLQSGSECITRNPETGKLEVTTEKVGYVFNSSMDGADVTAPSISYWPNDFGLYNMNGNVSEMISDKNLVVGGDWRSPGYDIRNESARAYKGSSVTVGFRVIATYVEN